MSDDYSYLEQEEGAAPVAFDEVMGYIRIMEEAEEAIRQKETELDTLKKKYQDLAEKVIPTCLAQHGLRDITLDNGRKLEVKEDLFCSLPKDPVVREELLGWLDAHGAGDKVTKELLIDSPSEEAVALLDAAGTPYALTKTVNPSSLKALFREMLGMKKGTIATIEQNEVPKEFNVYIRRMAVIK